MREAKQNFREVDQPVQQQPLDLVVPFTTPELTRAALKAAGRMSGGLDAAVRLIKVQVVPYPMELDVSQVYIDFLRDQLDQCQSELPITQEIRVARDFASGLEGALTKNSIVILATPRRIWRTHNERLACLLRLRGYQVAIVSQTKD